ncbi:hypothetical protein [Paenibacillus polymyxa]|uniref:hypothetical protein n=1 Tax=Paenibacillus polymyxa TaxID=1406 RepID=UPI00129A1F57|nr:hypothetical protein [Paenibacillus polymyxa]KAE8559125.1 hypothetical protein BJH92_16055 [Paenibacillus polymyxa]MCJ1222251.1 hypothetical protein [Paenibacillus polymyxa]
MKYTLLDWASIILMTLEYKPDVGDLIRNDVTGNFYHVERVDEENQVCYGSMQWGGLNHG